MLYLSKALNLYSSSVSGNFSDVPAGSYYYDAIATAKALDIAQGSNNKFYPNSTITREDAMVLALRAMSKSGYAIAPGNVTDLSTFKDNGTVSDYAKEAVAALIRSGIINGSDGNINPKSTITRAEAAAMIYRIKY
jgi:20S proteasome alpha/beta subunit